MSTVVRDADAELRHSRAQRLFAAATGGVRDWLSDLHAARPLLGAIDALPAAADVRALLDPLQDSALTRLGAASPAASDAQAPAVEPHAAGAGHTSPAARRVTTASRFAAADRRALPSRAAQPGAPAPVVSTTPVVSTNVPARVAALLARHAHVRHLVAEDALHRMPWSVLWSDVRTERRIVPFSGHRAAAGEPPPRSQPALSPPPLTAVLARWTQAAATETAQRIGAATSRALAGYERTPPASTLAPLHAAAPTMRGAPATLARSAKDAEPVPAPLVLRLADLAAPALPQDTRRTQAPAPGQETADATNASVPPATGGSVLGRMAGALARIEERLAASTASAEAPTQWLAEDDDLAERIHDILRHQARRHGIDTP